MEPNDDDENDPDDPMTKIVREILDQMLSEATSGKPTPIVLPPDIIEELKSYCQERSIPNEKLIPLAMKGTKNRWDEIVGLMAEYVKDPDDFKWPLNPLDCLVIAFLHEATRRFEEKFSALDKPDPADWWKENLAPGCQNDLPA